MNCFSIVLFRCTMDEFPCRVFVDDHEGAIHHASGLREVPEDIRSVLGVDPSERHSVGVLRMLDGRPTDYTEVLNFTDGTWRDLEGPGDGDKITQADLDLLEELGMGNGVET